MNFISLFFNNFILNFNLTTIIFTHYNSCQEQKNRNCNNKEGKKKQKQK